jgi:hypothetical protein
VNALGINATVPSIPPDLDSSEAVQRLGSALGVTLPEDFGQITIMTQEQLAGYQEAANDLKKLSGGLIALSIVLLILTIVVAPSRRRALIWLGVGVVAAVLLGGVFIRRLEARVVDAIPGAGGQAAARDVFAQVSSSLRTWGWTILAISLVVGLVAYLAGRPPWVGRTAAWVRRISAEGPGGSPLEIWIARRADPVRIGAVAVAVLVLFLTGIAWIPVLLVGVVLAAFLWWVAATKRKIPTPGDPEPVSVPEAEAVPKEGRESMEGVKGTPG